MLHRTACWDVGRHFDRNVFCYLYCYVLSSGFIWLKVGKIDRLLIKKRNRAEYLVNLKGKSSDIQPFAQPVARDGEPLQGKAASRGVPLTWSSGQIIK